CTDVSVADSITNHLSWSVYHAAQESLSALAGVLALPRHRPSDRQPAGTGLSRTGRGSPHLSSPACQSSCAGPHACANATGSSHLLCSLPRWTHGRGLGRLRRGGDL